MRLCRHMFTGIVPALLLGCYSAKPGPIPTEEAQAPREAKTPKSCSGGLKALASSGPLPVVGGQAVTKGDQRKMDFPSFVDKTALAFF